MRSVRTPDRLFDAPLITVLETLYAVLSRPEPPRECPVMLYRAWSNFN